MGEIVSKQTAANWGKETLDPRWIPLIDGAWLGRQNPASEPLPEDARETQEMIRYAMRRAKPTSYPDVNAILNLLLVNVKEILGDQFVGMYLYGSLSSGDFNPQSSDIDFLVVTADVLDESIVSQLEALHQRIWNSGLKWASKLEGSYVHKDLIRRHDPHGAPCPTVNEGKLFLDRRGSDWIIQRHVVRECGVVVEGPDPKTLIDSASPQEIRDSVMGVMREWWIPMLDDPSWLRDHANEYRAFAIITMCRVLHALEHGTIVSKPKAVQWARNKLDEPRQELIDKAVTVADHKDADLPLDKTLEFIRFTSEKVK